MGRALPEHKSVSLRLSRTREGVSLQERRVCECLYRRFLFRAVFSVMLAAASQESRNNQKSMA